jgi:hypothetical protein
VKVAKVENSKSKEGWNLVGEANAISTDWSIQSVKPGKTCPSLRCNGSGGGAGNERRLICAKSEKKSQAMSAYLIHVDYELKEAFSYLRPLNEDSVHALGEYAKATYDEHAGLRHMTPDEESEYARTAIYRITDVGQAKNLPNWRDVSEAIRSQKRRREGLIPSRCFLRLSLLQASRSQRTPA